MNNQSTLHKFLAALLVVLLALAPVSALGAAETTDYAAYEAAVDMDFALTLATTLSESFHSSPLGSRNAGSDAEHEAAEYIAQVMREIGLSDVMLVPIVVDKWSNNGASLQVAGDEQPYRVHSYASGGTSPEGIAAELVYAGKGTAEDFAALDVTGKIVLVDVDQRNEWWITYPTLEAAYHGAAAILLANLGGFSEVSPDALNLNDFCGPVSIPSLSISQNDAQRLRALLESGAVQATLVVDNVVEQGTGISYNVMGKLPGKNPGERIVIGSHYDTHFAGFQDNSCAVAFALTMAKAMVEAGYTPERDIVFVADGAEEWGAIDTVFDWSTGAYGMLTQAYPEWIGSTLAFINSELPAYAFGETTRSDTAPELYSFITNYLASGAAVQPAQVSPTLYPGGVVAQGYQTYTYSDDFSYYSLGIPSIINGFLWTDDGEGVWDFYHKYYHSDYDTKETYDEDALRFNVLYYGAMVLYMDKTPVVDLDYTHQHARLLASVDEDIARAAGADVDTFLLALEAYGQAAQAAYAKVTALNAEAATADGDAREALWAQARTLNTALLSIFQRTQEAFLGLMYERPVVRHEAQQENIALMQLLIELLQAGDVDTAVDEYAWLVNNINEWYAYAFSPEVTAIFNDMMFGERSQGNLFWGTNRMVPYVDVEEATRSLVARYGEENGSFEAEIAVYAREITVAQAQYAVDMAAETLALTALTQALLEAAQ